MNKLKLSKVLLTYLPLHRIYLWGIENAGLYSSKQVTKKIKVTGFERTKCMQENQLYLQRPLFKTTFYHFHLPNSLIQIMVVNDSRQLEQWPFHNWIAGIQTLLRSIFTGAETQEQANPLFCMSGLNPSQTKNSIISPLHSLSTLSTISPYHP